MILSRPFAVSIAVLVLVDLFARRLPAPVPTWPLVVTVLLLPAPALLSRYAMRALLNRTLTGQPLGAMLRLAVAANHLAVPAVFGFAITYGGLLELADHLAADSWFLHTALILLPLLAMDLAVRAVEFHRARWLELNQYGGRAGQIRSKARLTTVVVGIILLFAGVADLVVDTSRTAEVWLTQTDAGLTLCMILGIAILPVLLPPALLFALRTDRQLPAGWAQPVARVCEQLGFPPDRVRILCDSPEVITAALVGSVPGARFLLLTDGILTALDPFALRGVIAHEVAHLRARHIEIRMLALFLIPALLAQPIATLDPGALTPETWFLVLAGATATGWFAMRALLLRFEYEADIGSAELLGTSESTIAALQRVAALLPGSPSWIPGFHPSESDRIALLDRWQREPEWRTGFARRSRLLRRVLAVVLAGALTWNLSVHASNWSLDRIRVAFLTGDFATAAQRIEAVSPTVRDRHDEQLEELRLLTAAATELVGAGGGEWGAVREELAQRAWPRALAELDRSGPAAAYPWAALAIANPGASALRHCVFEFCDAAANDDTWSMRRMAEHLEGWQRLPEPVRRATTAALSDDTRAAPGDGSRGQ